LKAELRDGFQRLNRRLDRLFYLTLAVGAVVMAAIFGERFIPG
jgi:hypothetical protein